VTSTSERRERLAVVGPGAIGATFAAVAQRAGMGAVPLYGRRAVPGITVHPDDGDPVVLAGEVRTAAEQARRPLDWPLLAVIRTNPPVTALPSCSSRVAPRSMCGRTSTPSCGAR
jgi:hypothetical protein